jgi:biopolymer transport protein ExbD
MRLKKHRRPTQLQMDMTPMIDVAFQLIIFFMTVSQMSEVAHERLQLPRQIGAEEQKPKTLIVNVSDTGQLKVAGEPLTIARLVSLVSAEVRRLDDDPQRLIVVVRADERGRSQAVNEVITALGTLGVTRVRIAVQSEG